MIKGWQIQKRNGREGKEKNMTLSLSLSLSSPDLNRREGK